MADASNSTSMKGGEGKKAGKDLRNSLKKSDVTEIKSLSAPPENVKQVMRETLVLLGYKRKELQDYGFIKKVIGSSKFLSQLKELKAEDVPVGVAAEVKSEMSSLSYEQLSKVSRAAASFYPWCIGVIAEVDKLSPKIFQATIPNMIKVATVLELLSAFKLENGGKSSKLIDQYTKYLEAKYQ